MKTLLLIDAHAFIHRAFHALPPLTNPFGKPVNAIFGLTNTLIKTLQTEKPDYVAACFDRPEPTFRKKEYAEYKAHRPELADDLISQLNEARNFFEAFKVSVLDKAGYEADDIIGTLAIAAKKAGLKVVILTGDQDTLQLVSDGKILVRTPKKGISEMITYDEAGVVAKLGVQPEQVIDYKGLCGDASDNIPGVPGIGPKTAQKLIHEYGEIENLYERIKKSNQEELTTLEKKLLQHEKEARLSKKLATIDTRVPIDIDFEKLTFRNGTHAETLDYLRKMGFQSILQRLQNTENQEARSGDKRDTKKDFSPSHTQDQLFSIHEKREILKNRKETPHTPKDVLLLAEKLELTDKLFDKKITKIAFDAKELIRESRLQDALEISPLFDLHIAAWLLNPDIRDWSPEILGAKYLNEDQEISEYFLYQKIREELNKSGLERVFNDFEMPLVDVLAKMERWGIRVSTETLTVLQKEIDLELKGLEKTIYEAAGQDFNINSPKQLGVVLFEKLKLKTPKSMKTPGGELSTAEKVLKTLADQHPIINHLLTYRQSFKIQSTYVEPLLALTRTERIHARFIQTGTATGRISSEQPNMQNIPQESKWSKAIRKAFISEKGWSFLSLDYSQLELRLLGHITQDKQMLKAFREGQDIHKHTASLVFKTPEAEVTPQMRRLAKVLNFGIIYGMGPRRIAEETKSSLVEAKEFLTNYLGSYPEIERWQKDVIAQTKEDGFVRNENGRMRLFPSIHSSNQRYSAEAERQAINFPVQSLEADVLKRAMIETTLFLKSHKLYGTHARLLLTIHDELLFEVTDELVSELIPSIKNIMEQVFTLSVPLVCEAKTGKNWGEMN